MIQPSNTSSWDTYLEQEIRRVKPILARLGYGLDATQLHVIGERSVMSQEKIVLLGKRMSDGKRVVIKASSQPMGQIEMKRERACRHMLDHIRFAYDILLSPEQILWHEQQGCLISITEYIEQERPFLERPLKDQFFLVLKAFETQEHAHAATYEHARMIEKTFGLFHASTYIQTLEAYHKEIRTHLPNDIRLHALLSQAAALLHNRAYRIDQYGRFLTHWDFVPHNFRIRNDSIYLLDHSSIRFGNKYEGWARFLNFMLLHNRELEHALLQYLFINRAPEEAEALQAMRVYRLTELIRYYMYRAQKSVGNLEQLDHARIAFWTDVLQSVLEQVSLSDMRIQQYRELRDTLRSDEEKRRQRGLH